jgi:DNA-binding CsgD family transcriptional regulator
MQDNMKETNDGVNLLYKDIIKRFTPLSDSDYMFPPEKVEYLRQMALASNQTLALCNRGRNTYTFLNVRNPDFRYFFKPKLDMDKFLTIMHPDDLAHFHHAWEFVLMFISDKIQDDIMSYVLVFECRLKDFEGNYQRVMFKYKIILDDDGEKGQLVLFLRSVDGSKSLTPPRGMYVIDVRNKNFKYCDKDSNITNREIEIIRYSMKGFSSEEIGQMLNLSKNTVNNHRRNVLDKISVRDNGYAAMYFREMGLI